MRSKVIQPFGSAHVFSQHAWHAVNFPRGSLSLIRYYFYPQCVAHLPSSLKLLCCFVLFHAIDPGLNSFRCACCFGGVREGLLSLLASRVFLFVFEFFPLDLTKLANGYKTMGVWLQNTCHDFDTDAFVKSQILSSTVAFVSLSGSSP